MTGEQIEIIVKLIKAGICIWIIILGAIFILSQHDKISF